MKLSKRTFSHLYDQFAPKIFRFVFFKTGSAETAQDLTSEVFLKSWQYWQAGKKVKHPQAMFYQVARHQIADYYRGRKPVVSIEEKELDIIDDQAGAEKNLVHQEEFSQVYQALQKLKPDYKDVLIWRYLEGFSYRQISLILRKPRGTIRVMVHRAVKSLRNKIEEV